MLSPDIFYFHLVLHISIPSVCFFPDSVERLRTVEGGPEAAEVGEAKKNKCEIRVRG